MPQVNPSLSPNCAVNATMDLARISPSETYTIAPPANARPNASRRALGVFEAKTSRPPKPVARPATVVTASATSTFCIGTSIMRGLFRETRHPSPAARDATATRWPGRSLLCIASIIPAKDDPCRALVGPVGHRPVEQHHRAVAETDQEEQVGDQPEPPGQHAREAHRAQIDDRGHATDGREVAGVAIAERHRRRTLQSR